MGSKTGIEWTDATWSPLRVRVRPDAAAVAEAKGYTSLVQIAAKMAGRVGPHCEKVSDGCCCCYACTRNRRCLPANGTGLPFDRRSRDLVEPFVDENALLLPLRWKEPRRIFVENQSDLFGEWHTDEMVDRVFAVAALCCVPGCSMRVNATPYPLHTLQMLTKRAKRMREYFDALDVRRDGCLPPRILAACDAVLKLRPRDSRNLSWDLPGWPLENVWLGVSVENRACKERIEVLRDTPAAVRFLSIEPLLEDLGELDLRGIDWVIVGGESGPGARPMHPDCARTIRDQCVAAGVPFFFKQWGTWSPGYIERCYEVKGYRPKWERFPEAAPWWPDGTRGIGDHKTNGGQAVSWTRIGKKKAGRLLDGREWNEMPEARA